MALTQPILGEVAEGLLAVNMSASPPPASSSPHCPPLYLEFLPASNTRDPKTYANTNRHVEMRKLHVGLFPTPAVKARRHRRCHDCSQIMQTGLPILRSHSRGVIKSIGHVLATITTEMMPARP